MQVIVRATIKGTEKDARNGAEARGLVVTDVMMGRLGTYVTLSGDLGEIADWYAEAPSVGPFPGGALLHYHFRTEREISGLPLSE